MQLHIVHIFDSLGVGGLEKGVVTLANHTSADVKHTILCLRTTGPSVDKLPKDTHVVALNKEPGNSFRFLGRMAAELKKISPDLVHTRNWGGMDGIIAARMAGIKNIVHGEHGWDLLDPQGQLRKRRIIRRFLSLTTCEFISVSKAIKRWLEEDVRISRPVTQIYNGVDTDLFQPIGDRSVLRRELGLSENSRLIGIVARLDPIKDHTTLLRAFTSIAQHYRDAHLVIIGDGSERGRLNHPGFERVHFLGNRTDIPELMRGFDVFVLPSINEGISNTILEAMASGVPVIVSEVGGNPELVRNGVDGLLFPVGDYFTLEACLGRYLDHDELRQAHGVNGRQRTVEKFSIESMVSQYEQVWRRVAAQS